MPWEAPESTLTTNLSLYQVTPHSAFVCYMIGNNRSDTFGGDILHLAPGPLFSFKISYHLVLPVWATSMLKERRLVKCLSFNMGLPKLVRRIFILKRGPVFSSPSPNIILPTYENCEISIVQFKFCNLNCVFYKKKYTGGTNEKSTYFIL